MKDRRREGREKERGKFERKEEGGKEEKKGQEGRSECGKNGKVRRKITINHSSTFIISFILCIFVSYKTFYH